MRSKSVSLIILMSLMLWTACDEHPTESTIGIFKWPNSLPENQGMDGGLLRTAMEQADELGFVDGLLVIRNGFIVAENYYNQYHKDNPHNIMSVSKSFLSAITGLAFEQGYLDSLEHPVLDYFPEYNTDSLDTRKQEITIRHLMTMRMGIPNEEENYFDIYNSPDWIETTLEWPLEFGPGERMRYNTFQTHLLSAIITKATGMSTMAFAQAVLTDPMGITIHGWEQDPQGYYFGGNAMFFTPREMAVLGYLYLNGGRISDVQIVPAEWIALTLKASTNNQPNEWGAWKNYNYAYLWWLGEFNEYPVFMAYGYGGQFIIVFPDLNMIIVTTAENQVDPETSTIQEWAIFDIVAGYIIPAVKL